MTRLLLYNADKDLFGRLDIAANTLHITYTLKQLKFLPVSVILRFRDATLLYNSIHGLTPTYLQQLVVKRSDNHKRHTRNSVKLQVPKCRTALAYNSFHDV